MVVTETMLSPRLGVWAQPQMLHRAAELCWLDVLNAYIEVSQRRPA
jgi:hypothetical protein